MAIIRFLLIVLIAYFAGKLVSYIKLPAILGWLLTGMIFGPHAIGLVDNQILNSAVYQNVVHLLECAVGLMIGTELVWNKIKQAGKPIVITTFTQSIWTFIFVSLVFSTIFYFVNVPIYLGFVFGGIALATAPAPALSIVSEFKTDGPVTRTLLPMAALDDIIGVIVFFSTMAIISTKVAKQSFSAWLIPVVVLLPIIIGAIIGYILGLVLRKCEDRKLNLTYVILGIVGCFLVGFVFNNYIMPSPVLNFMLIGMAFATAFSNMIDDEKLDTIMEGYSSILGVSMIVVILNLGAPLDYHLIMGAGLYTAVYIIARAIGKYSGAYFGAAITDSPKTVKKYLGLTLLPHSGVSLVFTGIAVSILGGSAPECAQIVQGTIAAAAVINEIIAVIISKKAFEWAGEFNKQKNA